MRIILIGDTFPPKQTSGAVQLRDLSRELVSQGHDVTVLIPSSKKQFAWKIEKTEGYRVLRLNSLQIKGTSYFSRTLAEVIMPFAMYKNFQRSPLASERWDAVIWYSPSIFFGPLVKILKEKNNCKSYLIIRDIFPQWALDIGLIKKGLPYKFFDYVARFQYSIADIIGVQSTGNLKYFLQWQQRSGRKLEVLQNWLGKPANVSCPIRIKKTVLAGRKILVYAGNMGVAQGINTIIDLAKKMQRHTDVGFLFVGRGSEKAKIQASAIDHKLNNVLFYDEIHPDEIPDLYVQCSAGIISLDVRHKTHNIPGKFLSYMQNGLPVIANLNANNDLAQIIRNEKVGKVCVSGELYDLLHETETLLREIKLQDAALSRRCRLFFERNFDVQIVVKQIITSLST